MLVTQEQRRLTREMHLKSPMIKSSDAARVLKISKQRLESYRKKQLVECIRIGGHWRYLLHSLQWLKRNYLSLSQKEKRDMSEEALNYSVKVNKINQLTLKNKLSIAVSTLPLPSRILNCCRNDCVNTIRDIVIKTEAEWSRIPNFGRKALNTLLVFLKDIGLSLGMDIDDLSESADLTNAYEVRLTNTKGLYKQVAFIVTANTLSEVYEKLWHTIKQEHIKYEVSNLGCVVNLNEIESHVENWLELN